MNNYVVVLGSNLSSEFGNSEETLKKCVDEIRSNPSIECLLESNWYVSCLLYTSDAADDA